MNLKNVRIGYAALSGDVTVYIRDNRHTGPGERALAKEERTEDFLNVLLQWCGAGESRLIEDPDGGGYLVAVREITQEEVEAWKREVDEKAAALEMEGEDGTTKEG